MGKSTVASKLGVIGVIDIVIGGFIELWLLTVGLFSALYSFSMNKTVSVLVYLFLGLVFGALFIKGGIGIRRKHPRSRIYLNTAWGISVLFIVHSIFTQLKIGFLADGIGSEYFSISSWLGGIIVCSIIAGLGILHIRFLNSSKVKELFI